MNIVLILFVSFNLVFKKEESVKTLAWVMVMILLPYLGIVLYILIGRNFRKEKMFNRKGAGDIKMKRELCKGMLSEYIKDPSTMPEGIRQYERLVMLNLRSSNSMVTTSDDSLLYFSGKDALEAMYKDIGNARFHIHLQSYILEDDTIGNKFCNLLIKKVKEGVEVRVIVDGLGSRKLSRKFKKRLKEAGVEFLIFSPFRWLFPPLIVNYRNHRKILVIDGKIGFIGGVNIADRYVNGGVFNEWRDTQIRLTGDIVHSLQHSFLIDRFFIINKNLRKRKKYYPQIEMDGTHSELEQNGDKIYAQVISSGPDSDWESFLDSYIQAISLAKNKIRIITPYFIISGPILKAIKIAALSGIDIRIMIPEKADSKLATWSTYSYISDLLSVGVKVYLFQNGFNHSKVMSIDDEFCIIGSVNMDYRSFYQHFEISSVFYDKDLAIKINKQFKSDTKRSLLISHSKWNSRPKKHKIREGLVRLISPIL